MSNATGRDRFQELSTDLWAAFRWVRDRDPVGRGSREEQITQVADESRIRELASLYAYTQNSKSLDWVRTIFAEDATFGNGPNAAKGIDEIMERYHYYTGERHNFSRHRFTNMLVRIMPDRSEAWLTAYVHTARTGYGDGVVESEFCRYFARFTRETGDWLIADWRPSVDFIQRYEDDIERRPEELRAPEPPDSPDAARQFTVQKNPPANGGRASWHELRNDPWAAHHWILDQPIPELSADEKLDRLVDEIHIREILSNYAYAHDSLDLAWSGSLFADDAMLINETSVFDGNFRVTEAFRGWNRNRYMSQHRFSNPLIRFVPGTPDAWLLAYFNVAGIGFDDSRRYTFGRYFGRLTKRSGRWQIVDWRISNDARQIPLKPSHIVGRYGQLPELPTR
jgi:ketosteroid isomerase-like protein